MRAALASILVALAGCASSAPHTLAAAALNTGLAAGVSGAQRASGGCYAVCTHGTACNPATGFCERADSVPDRALAACLPGEPCSRAPSDTGISKQGPAAQPGGPGSTPLGISPATGTAPPPLPPPTAFPPPTTPQQVKPE